jgi:hypothetical protein
MTRFNAGFVLRMNGWKQTAHGNPWREIRGAATREDVEH